MNKKVIIILVAILVVLLAAIAVIEIVKPDNKGYDELIVNGNSEKGVIADLETGSVVENTSENKITSSDKVLGDEVVGEQNLNSNDSSNATSGDSSSETQQTMEGFSPWQ